MRNTSIVVAVVVSIIVAALGETSLSARQQGKAEQELLQIERDWCAAVMKKDANLLTRILADDYTSVGSRGSTSNKAGDLASLKTETVTDCVDSNVKVRVYGDTAVVTGLGKRSGASKSGAYKDREMLWTDVFVKKDGRWQCVASQATVVAAQQKQ